jgi:hypothetical protein
MRKISLFLPIFGLLAFVSLPTTSAHAQATRTWVSGVGDDANPCSRTAPCKTFAGAISKTASGGEIDCLDPGGFGAVTITKAITIDCGPFPGGILASATNGVIINAGVNDKVILRNLVINGAGTTLGLNGIRWLAGLELEIDHVVIQEFSTRGIDVSKTALGVLAVRNSYFTQVPTGIRLSTTAGNIVASIHNSTFNFLTINGVEAASANAFANVSNSVFATGNGSAIVASASGAAVSASDNIISNNATGINASVSGAKIAATRNSLFDNVNAFNVAAGATFLSGGDNKVTGAAGSASTGNMTTK